MLALGPIRHHVLSASTGLPLIARIIPAWGLTADSGTATWAVYAIELATGVAVVAVGLANRKRLRIPECT
jgi:trans-2-enoyl-CoA reductase